MDARRRWNCKYVGTLYLVQAIWAATYRAISPSGLNICHSWPHSYCVTLFLPAPYQAVWWQTIFLCVIMGFWKGVKTGSWWHEVRCWRYGSWSWKDHRHINHPWRSEVSMTCSKSGHPSSTCCWDRAWLPPWWACSCNQVRWRAFWCHGVQCDRPTQTCTTETQNNVTVSLSQSGSEWVSQLFS